MQQGYADIGDYFEKLSKEHPEVKAYCRYELDELLDRTLNIPGFPCFVLEGFDFDYRSSSPDNVVKSRSGAFCLVDKCAATNNKERTEKLEGLERIAEQFLMRMVKDKRERHRLLTTFDISSAEGTHFANPAQGLVFCRISFSFKTKIEEEAGVWQ